MNSNTYIEDMTIRHSVYLQRLAGGYVKKLSPILELMQEELLKVVDSSAYSAMQRAVILEQIRQLHNASTDQFTEEMIALMESLAEYESQYSANLLSKATGKATATPSGMALNMAVANARLDAPISRLTLTQALEQFGRKKAIKAQNAINDAIFNNLTKEQAKESLVSTLNVTKANAEALIRSSTNLVANTARNATYLANNDIVEASEYVAKLDTRTTDVCRQNDGKIYPVGQNPAGTLHWNCRSAAVAVIKEEFVKDDL